MYWLSALSSMQEQELKQEDRGAQCKEGGSLNLEPDGLINLVHYEDAATATVKALTTGE